MFVIELQKAENGFVVIAYTYAELKKGAPKYYIAKDSEQVGEICKKLAGEYQEEAG